MLNTQKQMFLYLRQENGNGPLKGGYEGSKICFIITFYTAIICNLLQKQKWSTGNYLSIHYGILFMYYVIRSFKGPERFFFKLFLFYFQTVLYRLLNKRCSKSCCWKYFIHKIKHAAMLRCSGAKIRLEKNTFLNQRKNTLTGNIHEILITHIDNHVKHKAYFLGIFVTSNVLRCHLTCVS